MRSSAREPKPSLGANDFEWGWHVKRSRDPVARPRGRSGIRKRPKVVKPVATFAVTDAWTENEDQAAVGIFKETGLFTGHEDLEELAIVDGFNFESMMALGAMSHTMQPVSTDPPSPDTIEAFPALAHRFSPDLTAYEPPIKPERPPGKSFIMRVVTRDLQPKNHGNIRMTATIRPFYDSHVRLTMRNRFSEINTLLNTPPKNKASAPLMRIQRTQNIKFNANLVCV